MDWIWYVWAVFGVAIWCLVYIADRHRSQILRSRQVLQWRDWLQTYYPSNSVSEEVITDVLNMIADVLAVHPTRIRPRDSFQHELSCRSRWARMLQDDPDGGFEEGIERIRLKYGIRTPLRLDECATVDEMIRRIDHLHFAPAGGEEGLELERQRLDG